MRIIKKGNDITPTVVEEGVKKVEVARNGFITIDGVSTLPPISIESEVHTGFFALKDLAPVFKHMKCWNSHDGSDCLGCPVKYNDTCGIMGIKDAAEKEAAEKGAKE
jgi:hypothetical protein